MILSLGPRLSSSFSSLAVSDEKLDESLGPRLYDSHRFENSISAIPASSSMLLSTVPNILKI